MVENPSVPSLMSTPKSQLLICQLKRLESTKRYSTVKDIMSPIPGSPDWGSSIRRNPQGIWLWRPVGLGRRNPQHCGKRRFHSGRLHTMSSTWQKRQPHRRLGQTYLLVFEGLLGRWGAAVALWGHISWRQMQLGPMLTPARSRHFFHLWLWDLAPPDNPWAPMLGLTGQTTHRAGTEPHTTFRHVPADLRAKTQLHPRVGVGQHLPPRSLKQIARPALPTKRQTPEARQLAITDQNPPGSSAPGWPEGSILLGHRTSTGGHFFRKPNYATTQIKIQIEI